MLSLSVVCLNARCGLMFLITMPSCRKMARIKGAESKHLLACDGAVSEAPLLGGSFQNALLHTALGLHSKHQNLHQVLTLVSQLPEQCYEAPRGMLSCILKCHCAYSPQLYLSNACSSICVLMKQPRKQICPFHLNQP